MTYLWPYIPFLVEGVDPPAQSVPQTSVRGRYENGIGKRFWPSQNSSQTQSPIGLAAKKRNESLLLCPVDDEIGTMAIVFETKITTCFQSCIYSSSSAMI